MVRTGRRIRRGGRQQTLDRRLLHSGPRAAVEWLSLALLQRTADAPARRLVWIDPRGASCGTEDDVRRAAPPVAAARWCARSDAWRERSPVSAVTSPRKCRESAVGIPRRRRGTAAKWRSINSCSFAVGTNGGRSVYCGLTGFNSAHCARMASRVRTHMGSQQGGGRMPSRPRARGYAALRFGAVERDLVQPLQRSVSAPLHTMLSQREGDGTRAASQTA